MLIPRGIQSARGPAKKTPSASGFAHIERYQAIPAKTRVQRLLTFWSRIRIRLGKPTESLIKSSTYSVIRFRRSALIDWSMVESRAGNRAIRFRPAIIQAFKARPSVSEQQPWTRFPGVQKFQQMLHRDAHLDGERYGCDKIYEEGHRAHQ
jgi:hypothetical protein